MKRWLLPGAGAVLLAAALLANGSAGAQAPGGEQLFDRHCAACHHIAQHEPSMIGPNLYGVVGRPAAQSPMPYSYSRALRESGLTWSRENLDRYMAAPRKVVPGTRMIVALPDPAERAAIIAYMARTE